MSKVKTPLEIVDIVIDDALDRVGNPYDLIHMLAACVYDLTLEERARAAKAVKEARTSFTSPSTCERARRNLCKPTRMKACCTPPGKIARRRAHS